MIHKGGENMIFVGKCLASSCSCLASHASGIVSPAGVKILGCVLLGKTCYTCLNGHLTTVLNFFKKTHLLCLFGAPFENKEYYRISWRVWVTSFHLINITVTSRQLLNVLLEVLFSFSFVFSPISVSGICESTNHSMASIHVRFAAHFHHWQLRVFGNISLNSKVDFNSGEGTLIYAPSWIRTLITGSKSLNVAKYKQIVRGTHEYT